MPLGLLVANLLLSSSEAGLENECGAQYSHSLEQRCYIEMHMILTSGNDQHYPSEPIILFKRYTSFSAQVGEVRLAGPRPRVVGEKGLQVQAASSTSEHAFSGRIRVSKIRAGQGLIGERPLQLSDLSNLPRLLTEVGTARFTQGTHILHAPSDRSPL